MRAQTVLDNILMLGGAIAIGEGSNSFLVGFGAYLGMLALYKPPVHYSAVTDQPMDEPEVGSSGSGD